MNNNNDHGRYAEQQRWNADQREYVYDEAEEQYTPPRPHSQRGVASPSNRDFDWHSNRYRQQVDEDNGRLITYSQDYQHPSEVANHILPPWNDNRSNTRQTDYPDHELDYIHEQPYQQGIPVSSKSHNTWGNYSQSNTDWHGYTGTASDDGNVDDNDSVQNKGEPTSHWRRSLTEHEEQCLQRLISALKTDSQPIALGGKINLSQLESQTGGNSQGQVDVLGRILLVCGTLGKSSDSNDISRSNTSNLIALRSGDQDGVQEAFTAAKPSSHGQGDQLVYDENVRLAREIPAACLYLSNAISDHIATLTDIIGRKIGLINIAVKLDKLSLYGPGGHFATHKDTARGQDHIGTLLIALPFHFTGGDMLVRDAEQEHCFDWSSLEVNQLGWAFFYADKDHEIMPVKAGYRAVLQFQVDGKIEDGGPRSDVISHNLRENANEGSTVLEVLKNLFADETFLPEGFTLAFGLKHLYPLPRPSNKRSYRAESPVARTSDYIFAHLKGDDAVLYRSLTLLGLCDPKVAVAFDPHKSLTGGSMSDAGIPDDVEIGGDIPKDSRASSYVYTSVNRYTKDMEETTAHRLISYHTSIGSNPITRDYHISEDPDDLFEAFGMILHPSLIWMTETISNYANSTAYLTFGNEPGLEYAYTALIMLVKVPSFAARQEVKLPEKDRGAETA